MVAGGDRNMPAEDPRFRHVGGQINQRLLIGHAGLIDEESNSVVIHTPEYVVRPLDRHEPSP